MRIVELKAENIKNLKVIEIKPDGNTITLTGANGAGKSSVLDAIFVGLTGKKPKELIRRGEDRAVIEVDLGEFKIRRVFTGQHTRVEVLNSEGLKFSSPQRLLDRLLGTLSFDPLAFQRMTEKDQRKLMLELAGLDLSDMETAREDLYDQRTLKNRELRNLEGSLSQMEKPGANVPDREQSISVALDSIRVMEERRDKFSDAVIELAGFGDGVEKAKKAISEAQNTIKQLEKHIEIEDGKVLNISKEIEEFKLPEEITKEDINVARGLAEEIEGGNALFRAAGCYRKEVEAVASAKEDVVRLTSDIDDIDREKAEAITNSIYPVKGLSVDDNTVLFNGLPFSQASTGQQINISTAIAMALNPKLRVILIRDGSLLDQEALKSITDAAKDKDYQIWIERMNESGNVGIFLEDGEIRAVDGNPIVEEKACNEGRIAGA